MSLNLFEKIYLSPDYLYDNGYNRILFSKDRNQAEYLNYDSFEFPGLGASLVHSSASILNIVGTEPGQHASAAHYLEHLYDSGFEGRIYADEESWMIIFYSWIRITFPNIDDDTIFTLYNIVKQRENLVFPINRDLQNFMIPRLNSKSTNPVLNKTELLEHITTLRSGDTNSDDYYNSVNAKVKNSLSVEIHIASYFSGRATIDPLVDKIQRLGSKSMFSLVQDLRDYIRENIMTENVKSLTGVTLSWDDQDWETTLKNTSSMMALLFNSSAEAIYQDFNYRLANLDTAFQCAQWVIDVTNNTDDQTSELDAGRFAAEYYIKYYDGVFSEDESTRKTTVENLIKEDAAYNGSTFIFQEEQFREKINTFFLEYIYQLYSQNNADKLVKISHT